MEHLASKRDQRPSLFKVQSPGDDDEELVRLDVALGLALDVVEDDQEEGGEWDGGDVGDDDSALDEKFLVC